MKKLFCSIASLATAVFTFIFLSITCMTSKAIGKTNTVNAWDMLKDETGHASEIDGYTLFKIFTIIAIIVACVLAILGIILLLQQFGIVKAKLNFGFISAIALAVFTVVAVVAMIGVIVMCNTDLYKLVEAAVGIGMILNVVVGAIATVIAFLFCREK